MFTPCHPIPRLSVYLTIGGGMRYDDGGGMGYDDGGGMGDDDHPHLIDIEMWVGEVD